MHPANEARLKVQKALEQLGASTLPSDWQFRVALVGSPPWLETKAGQQVFFAAANLLCRMHPVISELHLCLPCGLTNIAGVPRLGSHAFEEALRTYLGKIGVATRVVFLTPPQMPDAPDALMILGHKETSDCAPGIHVESIGWAAHLTRYPSRLAGPWFGNNPLGAFLAGGLAAAEVLKQALARLEVSPSFRVAPMDSELWFSAWNYGQGELTAGTTLPEVIKVDTVTIAGVGSGGMSTVLALGACGHIEGRIALIDPDTITFGNLDRYASALIADAEARRSKTSLAYELLAGTGAEVSCWDLPWSAAAGAIREAKMLGCVLSTVDKAAARWEIQQDLPGQILDAAVNRNGELFISRIDFGRTCCLRCLYPDDGSAEREARALSSTMGLPIEEMRIMLRDNQAFTEGHLARIRAANSLGASVRLPAVGERLSDWRAKHCGRLQVSEYAEVPFGPVTFLAGVLLAGEIIKRTLNRQAMLDNRFVWNVLGLPPTGYPHLRQPNPKCRVCQDADYRRVYTREWGMQTN